MLELRGNAVLFGASPVVAGVGADDNLVGVLGHAVDQAPQPVCNPAGGGHGRKLGHLDAVWMNVPSDEVAAQPDDHPPDVRLVPLVLKAVEEPFFQLGKPQLTYVKRVVVLAVDRLGQHPLFAVDVRQHQDGRGVVLGPLLVSLDSFGQGNGRYALQRRETVAPLTLAVDLLKGRLVLGP